VIGVTRREAFLAWRVLLARFFSPHSHPPEIRPKVWNHRRFSELKNFPVRPSARRHVWNNGGGRSKPLQHEN
jgi:hypothetical protein